MRFGEKTIFTKRHIASVLLSVGIGLGMGPFSLAHANNISLFLDKISPNSLIPGAGTFRYMEEHPDIVAAWQGDKIVGYVVMNSDFVDSNGYSGKPIHILIGMDTNGILTGMKLMEHHEPIVLAGLPESDMLDYLDGMKGFDAYNFTQPAGGEPDIISGATVTVLIIYDSVTRAAAKAFHAIASSKNSNQAQGASPTEPRLQEGVPQIKDWKSLIKDGSVQRLQLSVHDVTKKFRERGYKKAAKNPESRSKKGTFIDLYVAQVSVPSIGLSLLGRHEWKNLTDRLAPGQQAILVMGKGLYSFKGSGYVRGGLFDRIQLNQGINSFRFQDKAHKRLSQIHASGAPEFTEVGLFLLPANLPEDSAFHFSKPWELDLLVGRSIGAREKSFVRFSLPYHLPRHYMVFPEVNWPSDVRDSQARQAFLDEETSARDRLWKSVWQSEKINIAILLFSLILLSGIFFFQMQICARPKLLKYIRVGFLLYSLLWLGWLNNAQLSVVNIFTFSSSLASGFSWQYFLVNPFIFILWFAVMAALLFWGRGPFCGWLCPFGALQELIYKAGRYFGIKHIHVPWGLHERLWVIKYMIFMGLFGLALYDFALSERFSEVEPFKTSIILNFIRDWPFVLYAVILLVIGLFIERFFCRYLCPLGAALAIPGRLRMFSWLKRWSECSYKCNVCAKQCPVQAIHPTGEINPNECIYCMHCQELYLSKKECYHHVRRSAPRGKKHVPAAGPAPVFQK